MKRDCVAATDIQCFCDDIYQKRQVDMRDPFLLRSLLTATLKLTDNIQSDIYEIDSEKCRNRVTVKITGKK